MSLKFAGSQKSAPLSVFLVGVVLYGLVHASLALAQVTPALGEAQQHSLRQALSFELEGSCVTRENVYRGLEYWLRTDLIDVDLTFAVKAQRQTADHGRRAEFTLRRSGEPIVNRELEGALSCDELTQALVLTMAIAVDGTVLDRTALGRPDLTPAGDSPPIQADPSESQSDEQRQSTAPDPPIRDRPKGRVLLQWDAGAAAAFFLIPETTVSTTIRGGVVWPTGPSLHFGLTHAFRQKFDASLIQATANLTAGQVLGCFGSKPSDGFLVRGCLGTLLGAAELEGHSSDDDRSSTAPVVGVGSDVSLGLRRGAMLFETYVTGWGHVVRPRLVVETPGGPETSTWPMASMQLGMRLGFVH